MKNFSVVESRVYGKAAYMNDCGRDLSIQFLVITGLKRCKADEALPILIDFVSTAEVSSSVWLFGWKVTRLPDSVFTCCSKCGRTFEINVDEFGRYMDWYTSSIISDPICCECENSDVF
jgi:hypothetical protein